MLWIIIYRRQEIHVDVLHLALKNEAGGTQPANCVPRTHGRSSWPGAHVVRTESKHVAGRIWEKARTECRGRKGETQHLLHSPAYGASGSFTQWRRFPPPRDPRTPLQFSCRIDGTFKLLVASPYFKVQTSDGRARQQARSMVSPVPFAAFWSHSLSIATVGLDGHGRSAW